MTIKEVCIWTEKLKAKYLKKASFFYCHIKSGKRA